MKYEKRCVLFSELAFLRLSASQSAAGQRVQLDRILGVEA